MVVSLKRWPALAVILMLVCTAGCSRAYYNTMERLGIPKRDILVDRVVKARDAQQEGQVQFESALEQFKSVVQVKESELEKVYKKLNREYEDSRAAADQIRERIEAIESVAKALFREWDAELDQYQNKSLRRESEAQLKLTRSKYEMLIVSMRNAESRMEPVLATMNDQVLYLKHNLNARAVQGLRDEVIKIDYDVTRLIAAMREAIAEADSFIAEMSKK